MAAHLFDHETFDGSDLLVVCVVNSGALDVIALNERVISSYVLADSTRIWIISEADRSATTLLLPDEY